MNASSIQSNQGIAPARRSRLLGRPRDVMLRIAGRSMIIGGVAVVAAMMFTMPARADDGDSAPTGMTPASSMGSSKADEKSDSKVARQTGRGQQNGNQGTSGSTRTTETPRDSDVVGRTIQQVGSTVGKMTKSDDVDETDGNESGRKSDNNRKIENSQSENSTTSSSTKTGSMENGRTQGSTKTNSTKNSTTMSSTKTDSMENGTTSSLTKTSSIENSKIENSKIENSKTSDSDLGSKNDGQVEKSTKTTDENRAVEVTTKNSDSAPAIEGSTKASDLGDDLEKIAAVVSSPSIDSKQDREDQVSAVPTDTVGGVVEGHDNQEAAGSSNNSSSGVTQGDDGPVGIAGQSDDESSNSDHDDEAADDEADLVGNTNTEDEVNESSAGHTLGGIFGALGIADENPAADNTSAGETETGNAIDVESDKTGVGAGSKTEVGSDGEIEFGSDDATEVGADSETELATKTQATEANPHETDGPSPASNTAIADHQAGATSDDQDANRSAVGGLDELLTPLFGSSEKNTSSVALLQDQDASATDVSSTNPPHVEAAVQSNSSGVDAQGQGLRGVNAEKAELQVSEASGVATQDTAQVDNAPDEQAEVVDARGSVDHAGDSFLGRTVGTVVNGLVTPLVRGTVTPVVRGTVGPIVRDTVAPLVHETVGSTVTGTVGPLLEETVTPLVTDTVGPVVQGTVTPLVSETVTPLVSEVVAPIAETVTPVVTEVAEPLVGGVVAPLVSDVVAPVISETVTPVVTEIAEPVVSGVIAPVTTEVVEPVVGGVLAPVLTEVAQPVLDGVVAPVVTQTVRPILDGVVRPVTDPLTPTLTHVTTPVISTVLTPVATIAGPVLQPVQNPGGSHEALSWTGPNAVTVHPTDLPVGSIDSTGTPVGVEHNLVLDAGSMHATSSVPMINNAATQLADESGNSAIQQMHTDTMTMDGPAAVGHTIEHGSDDSSHVTDVPAPAAGAGSSGAGGSAGGPGGGSTAAGLVVEPYILPSNNGAGANAPRTMHIPGAPCSGPGCFPD